ncbi:hypothetical protein M758_12G020200 [Ceratodon purpureus]|nr:hypothetical protein M758_12G020200 [Ceratodon purpureus]
MKKILHTQLSSAKQLQLSECVRAEEITHMLRMFPQDGTTVVPVRTYLEVVVTNILSRMVLKKRLLAVAQKGEKGQEFEIVRKFKSIVDEIAECSLHINPGDFIPVFNWIDIQGFRKRVRNLKKQMDAFMADIVSEHRELRKSGAVHDKDMVDVFLDQMEDKSLRFDVTEQSIYSALWDAFVAGTLTTTDSTEWAMAECIHNPEVMTKVQAELDAVVGKSRRVEEADIPNLKYLQAVVKETFRLHISPPMLIPRENENACKILGYDIPKGTTIIVNAAAIARNPSIWEDPLTFKPERFLEGSPSANTDVQGNNFELLPFGSGRRQCAGIGLGLSMTHILTATLLQSYDWSLPNDVQPTDLDMSEAPGMLPHRAQSLSAIPKARMSISSIVK